MSEWDCPPPDVIEVSVFGRGSGEAIVVHYGGGEWFTVDSFRVADEPIALTYLNQIGVDVAQKLKLVLATHWHDDHIKGIADLLEAASSARAAFPQAMVEAQFLEFARKFHEVPSGKVQSGVRELGSFLKIAFNRTPMLAEPTRSWLTLIDEPAGQLPHGFPIRVNALSPSGHDIVQFLGLVGSYTLPTDVAVSAPYYDQNEVSVALFVDAGQTGVLLGADLENVPNPSSGWKAVLADRRKPPQKTSLYKVSHHGSKTGEHPDIWTNLCTPDVIATLAPWSRGGRWLPTRDDVSRIIGCASEAFGAARTVTSGKRQALQSVNSILQNMRSRIRNVDLSVDKFGIGSSPALGRRSCSVMPCRSIGLQQWPRRARSSFASIPY